MTVARPPNPRLIVYIESIEENKPCFPDSVKLCKPLFVYFGDIVMRTTLNMDDALSVKANK